MNIEDYKQQARDYLVKTYRHATQKEINVDAMVQMIDTLAAQEASSDEYDNALHETISKLKSATDSQRIADITILFANAEKEYAQNAQEEPASEENNDADAEGARFDADVEEALSKRKAEFVGDIATYYDSEGENAEAVADLAADLFDDVKNGEQDKIGERLNILSIVTNLDDEDDRTPSTTGMIDAYAAAREDEDFSIDEFVRGTFYEFNAYAEEKRDQQFDALIDTYYEGDKDAAKDAKAVVEPHDKLQVIGYMKAVEQKLEEAKAAEDEEAIAAAQKTVDEAADHFQKAIDDTIETKAHYDVMDPLSREFQNILEENYQGEIDDEKAFEMGMASTPFFMKNILDNIKEEKKESAKAAAEEAGEDFDEKAFDEAYQNPSRAEVEAEAADFVRRLKEDFSEDDVKEGLTAGFDEYVAEQKAKQSAPQVGEKIKPTLGARLTNGLITVVGAGAAGMVARGAFATAMASTGIAGSVAAATGILGLVGLGAAGGMLAGYVGYSVSRRITAFTETKRAFKAQQPKASFVKAYFNDPNVKQLYAENYAATESKGRKWFSMLLGGTIGGVVAAWGDQIFGAASDFLNGSDNPAQQAGAGLFNFGSWADWLPFGGDQVADATGGLDAVDPADAIDPAEAPEPAETVEPVDAADPADAADPVDAADTADAVTIPTGVDADLKATIIEAAQEGGVTSYEAGIIDRLENGTLAQQVQAAKDFSLEIGGAMQIEILEGLNEQFGNLVHCGDVVADAQLQSAIGQVNSDLGILQLQQAIADGVADSADNEVLQGAIINMLEGADAGTSYAERGLAIAEQAYPEAFEAATASYETLSTSFNCATGAEGGLTMEVLPEVDPVDCDDEVVVPAADAIATDINTVLNGGDVAVEPVAAADPVPAAEPALEAATTVHPDAAGMTFDLDAVEPTAEPAPAAVPQADGFETAHPDSARFTFNLDPNAEAAAPVFHTAHPDSPVLSFNLDPQAASTFDAFQPSVDLEYHITPTAEPTFDPVDCDDEVVVPAADAIATQIQTALNGAADGAETVQPAAVAIPQADGFATAHPTDFAINLDARPEPTFDPVDCDDDVAVIPASAIQQQLADMGIGAQPVAAADPTNTGFNAAASFDAKAETTYAGLGDLKTDAAPQSGPSWVNRLNIFG